MPLLLAIALQASQPGATLTPRTLPPATVERMRKTLPPGYPLPELSPKIDGPIGTALLSPIFHNAPFVCTEHPAGQLGFVGDDLGTDCTIELGVSGPNGYLREFKTDGKANADWYGWHADILAPLDGVVSFLWINPIENTPGTFGKPPASEITIRGDNGISVTMAHIVDPLVKVGDRVKVEQVIAKVGNNGVARAPHTHIGAWVTATKEPLQIRWDQRQLAKLIGDD